MGGKGYQRARGWLADRVHSAGVKEKKKDNVLTGACKLGRCIGVVILHGDSQQSNVSIGLFPRTFCA